MLSLRTKNLQYIKRIRRQFVFKKGYIIINTLLWKMINNGKYDENVGKINLVIKDNIIILHFANEDKTYFKYNINLITNKNLLPRLSNNSISSIFQNGFNNEAKSQEKLIINKNLNNKISLEKLVDKLYLNMIEYNNFEKLIMNKLKLNGNNNNEIIDGYFLEKKLVF